MFIYDFFKHINHKIWSNEVAFQKATFIVGIIQQECTI